MMNNKYWRVFFILGLTGLCQADWTKINGIPWDGLHRINCICSGTDTTGMKRTLFTGLDTGVYMSLDTGKTWDLQVKSPKHVLSMYGNSLVGTQDSGLFNFWPGNWMNFHLSQLHFQMYPINAVFLINYCYLLGTNSGIYYNIMNTNVPDQYGLANRKINAIAATPFLHQVQFIWEAYYIYASTDTGIYFAVDTFDQRSLGYAQPKWEFKNNIGLPLKSIHSLFASDYPNIYIRDTSIVLAGTSNGIFVSKDRANTWRSFNEGLKDLEVSSIIYDYGTLSVWAATFTNNIAELWKRPLSELSPPLSSQYSRQLSKSAISINNCIFRYSLAQNVQVSVKVFEMRGRIVLSTKLGLQGIGEHTYSLAKLKTLTGNYVLEFTAGQNVTRKAFAIVR